MGEIECIGGEAHRDEAGTIVVVVQQATAPAVLGVAAAAHYCGVSEKQWRRWNKAGKIPAPIVLDKCHRWPRKTLDQWIELDCPERAEFVRKARALR